MQQRWGGAALCRLVDASSIATVGPRAAESSEAPSDPSRRAEISPLAELDVPLMTRLLRLEDGDVVAPMVLSAARDLRARLRAVARLAPPSARDGSFEGVLQDALRVAYTWAFGAIDALLAGERCPSTGYVEVVVVDVIDACDVRVAFDEVAALLRDTLLGVAFAMRELVRLAVTFDRSIPASRRVITGDRTEGGQR